MRERETCLPPHDESRINVNMIEEEMVKISHKAKPSEVLKDFDPDHPTTEDKVAFSFGEQAVPLMQLKKGEMVLIIKKGCGRDRRWCVGMSADKKLWGFFPMWCVDHMTSFLKLHEETKILQERQKLRDAEREAAEKSRIDAELSKCSFSPMVTNKAKELGAKKAELVVLPFDAVAERKAIMKAFASSGGPPAQGFTLKVGDQVEVIERRIGSSGKWCLGRMPRKSGTRRKSNVIKGVFPRWCIGENSLFHRMHKEMDHIEERRNAKAEKLRSEREEEFTVSILSLYMDFICFIFIFVHLTHRVYSHSFLNIQPDFRLPCFYIQFHPKTNRRKNLRMLKGYEQRREEREQKRIDKHIDHLFKECTFKPKLLKTKHVLPQRPDKFYMREKTSQKTLPMPQLNEAGRLKEPAYALIIKPFQWKRIGAVEQMLMPAFGQKNYPSPLSCYMQDKVLVLDTKCGRDERWALGKLGKDTGVFPMWCLPKQFHTRSASLQKSRHFEDSNGTSNGMYNSQDVSPTAPRYPVKTSPVKQTSPLARRKKHQSKLKKSPTRNQQNMKVPPTYDSYDDGAMVFSDFDSSPLDGDYEQSNRKDTVSAEERIRQRAAITKELPGMFRQIQNGLRNRASSLQKAFRMLDTDSSKVVNRHEFKAWLKKYGLVKVKAGQNQEQIMDLMFEQMDVDHDGQISFNEFARKLRTIRR